MGLLIILEEFFLNNFFFPRSDVVFSKIKKLIMRVADAGGQHYFSITSFDLSRPPLLFYMACVVNGSHM